MLGYERSKERVTILFICTNAHDNHKIKLTLTEKNQGLKKNLSKTAFLMSYKYHKNVRTDSDIFQDWFFNDLNEKIKFTYEILTSLSTF